MTLIISPTEYISLSVEIEIGTSSFTSSARMNVVLASIVFKDVARVSWDLKVPLIS